MLKVGTQNIAALRLGGQTIKKAYLGDAVVFSTGAAVTVSITAAIDPAGGGTVSGTGKYPKGSAVTLRAVPADGYQFTGWKEAGQLVNHNAEYTFTATENRALIAVFAVKPASRLPEGYTEVAYIESSGDQYIDTGVKPTSTIKFTIDVEPLTSAVSSTDGVDFARSIASTSGYTYYFYVEFVVSGVRVAPAYKTSGESSVAYKTLSADNSPRRMVVTVDYPNKKAFVVGEPEVSLTRTSTYTGMNAIALMKGFIYRENDIVARLYSCQIEIGGSPVRDFVPCTNPSGAVGLYDLVNGKFYGNSGTGTLTAGPAV